MMLMLYNWLWLKMTSKMLGICWDMKIQICGSLWYPICPEIVSSRQFRLTSRKCLKEPPNLRSKWRVNGVQRTFQIYPHHL